MSEEELIRYGSPTLAGLKTGNLFTCPYVTKKQTAGEIRQLNHLLVPCGLRVIPLLYRKSRVLVYLYSPDRLSRDLASSDAVSLLREQGYLPAAADGCLVQLIHRLRGSGSFPHEIGLFLGYPPEDVRGFMHDSAGCNCVGTWKVYGDEVKARKLFQEFEACTQAYCRQWEKGTPLCVLASPAGERKHSSRRAAAGL